MKWITRERPRIDRVACPLLIYQDDHEQLQQGFVMYDALFAWLKHTRGEKHDWNPQRV